MNVMTVDGFNARIEYDPEIDMFRGGAGTTCGRLMPLDRRTLRD